MSQNQETPQENSKEKIFDPYNELKEIPQKKSREIIFDLYSESEKKCMEKFPGIQVCTDINNTQVDWKSCKYLISEYQKCVKSTSPKNKI